MNSVIVFSCVLLTSPASICRSSVEVGLSASFGLSSDFCSVYDTVLTLQSPSSSLHEHFKGKVINGHFNGLVIISNCDPGNQIPGFLHQSCVSACVDRRSQAWFFVQTRAGRSRLNKDNLAPLILDRKHWRFCAPDF